MVKKRSKKLTKKAEDEIPDLDETVDPEDEDYFYDDVDKFHNNKDNELSKSLEVEEDSSEEDDEEEILALETEDESEEEDEDLEADNEDEEQESDDEGLEASDKEQETDDDSDEDSFEDGIISSKAWGKKRSAYYGAEKLDGLQGFDRDEVQDQEEQEALKIQKRLIDEIDLSQCRLDVDKVEKTTTTKSTEKKVEKIDVDVLSLSKKEQEKLLNDLHPEIQHLKSDLPIYWKQAEDLEPLFPLLKLDVFSESGKTWLINHHKICLLYCMNITHYFSIIMSKSNLNNHPIVGLLAKYRNMLNESGKLYEKLKPKVEWLKQPKQKWLFEKAAASSETEVDVEESKPVNTHIYFNNKSSTKITANKNLLKRKQVASVEEPKLSDAELEGSDDDESRRAVNRQIEKNTGIKKSKRRKLDRNPRVKHREKFRRANIRRKGQTKTYKPEINKYRGEISGIREGIIRSVNLK